jgi:hypothetical protein
VTIRFKILPVIISFISDSCLLMLQQTENKITLIKGRERWATGWTIGVLGFDSRRGGGNFSLHHRVQNGSGAHPASYPMRTRVSFPGGKAAGA